MVYSEVPGGDELAHTVPQAVFTLCSLREISNFLSSRDQ